jgi:hypothetical protein
MTSIFDSIIDENEDLNFDLSTIAVDDLEEAVLSVDLEKDYVSSIFDSVITGGQSIDTPKDLPSREKDRSAFWDTVPAIYKEAYNNSLGGIMHEMTTGKKYYNLVDQPKGIVHDIAAGFLSFFASKEDLGLMLTTGITGGIASKAAIKGIAGKAAASVAVGPNRTTAQRAAAMLTKRGGLSQKAAQSVVDDVIQIGGQQAFMLGAHDGFYEAARDARDEILASDVDLDKYKDMNYGQALGAVMKNADAKDFFRGGALGLAGGIGRMSKLISPLGKGSSAAGFVGEGLTFGALSPIAYEGRLPQFQDLAMAGGLTAALTLPGGIRAYGKKIKKQKLADEIGAKETAAATREAAYENSAVTQKAKLYEQVEQPFVNIKDIEDKRTLRPSQQFKRGRGTFQRTNIYGQSVTKVRKYQGTDTVVPEGTNIKGKVDTEIVFGGKQAIPFPSAKIVNGSFRQTTKKGKGFEMQIDVEGQGRFRLDAKNTELFFQFHTSDVELLRKFENNLGNIRNKRKILSKFHDVELRTYRQKALDGVEGYKAEDWSNALIDTINSNTIKRGQERGTSGFFRWANAIENGQTIKISNMTTSEKAILTQNLRNQKAIRDFIQKNSKLNDTNYMYQTSGASKGPFAKILGPLTPFYYHLTDPFARKIARLVNNVTNRTEQQVTERLITINQITKLNLDFDDRKWWEGYLRGEEKVSAWNDFNEIQKIGNKKLWLRSMDERIARAGGQEQQRLKLRRDLIIDTGSFSDEIWLDASSANLNLAKKVDGYLPRMFRKDVLDVMFDTMSTMEQKVLELTKLEGFNLDGNYTSATLDKLNSQLDGLVRQFTASKKPGAIEFKKVWNALSSSLASGGQPNTYDVFRVLNHGMYTNTLRPFSPLEKARKLANFEFTNQDIVKLVPELMEKDFTKLLVEYASGATKRIELSKAFTPSGAYFNQLLSRIDPSAEMSGLKLPKLLGGQDLPLTIQNQADAVKMIKEVFTGEINFDKTTPLSKSFQTIANLEMIGKISLGQAVIPNLTQTFISTAVEAGMGTTLKSIYRLATDAKLRDRVNRSGATILTAFDEIVLQDKALQIGASKLTKTEAPIKEFIKLKMSYTDGVTYLTKKTAYPFSKINEMNQMIAAATAEETVKKLGRAIAGKDFLSTLAPAQRKKWAVNKLGRMGLKEKDVIKHLDAIEAGRYTTQEQKLFRTKLLGSMQKFAKNSQLQRDFMLDPFLFNDPMIKPLLLFKRFGYRQATYMKRTIEREFIDGNVMPLLNLGIGGVAGGSFVMWAKEKMNQVLTGEPQFYGKEARIKLLKEDKTFDDYMNAISNVGSFGVMSDILTDEDPGSSISFFLKPVVIDDFQRLIRSYNTFAKSMETHYPEQWDVPFRKAATVLAPIAGGNISRLTRRAVETEGMKKDRIRNTKGRTVESIRDMIQDGNSKEAIKMYVEFNETYGSMYPSLQIRASDVSWKTIQKKWERKVKAQQEEKQYTP